MQWIIFDENQRNNFLLTICSDSFPNETVSHPEFSQNNVQDM